MLGRMIGRRQSTSASWAYGSIASSLAISISVLRRRGAIAAGFRADKGPFATSLGGWLERAVGAIVREGRHARRRGIG